MASRVKKTESSSTNTEGYSSRGTTNSTVNRGPDITETGASQDLTITKNDTGFTLSFRVPVSDICID